MKVLLQKVQRAQVTVGKATVSSIGRGYLLFLGVLEGDTEEQALWLARKVANLRLFPGEDGTVNEQSILDVRGAVLVVSQFTLAGRTERGNRPDYTRAADPRSAERHYERFLAALKEEGLCEVQAGIFGAMMSVKLVNDGPVTLLLER